MSLYTTCILNQTIFLFEYNGNHLLLNTFYNWFVNNNLVLNVNIWQFLQNVILSSLECERPRSNFYRKFVIWSKTLSMLGLGKIYIHRNQSWEDLSSTKTWLKRSIFWEPRCIGSPTHESTLRWTETVYNGNGRNIWQEK